MESLPPTSPCEILRPKPSNSWTKTVPLSIVGYFTGRMAKTERSIHYKILKEVVERLKALQFAGYKVVNLCLFSSFQPNIS